MQLNEDYVTIMIVEGGQIRPESINITRPWSGYVPVSNVVNFDDQPRKYFDCQDQESLDNSIKMVGQVQPATAILHLDSGKKEVRWMVSNGGRRLVSLEHQGIESFWIAYKPGVTRENIFLHAFIANTCKSDHTYVEIARAVDKLHTEGDKLSYEQIGKAMGKKPSWVEEQHSLLLLGHRLLPLLDPPTPPSQRMPFDVALRLAKLESSEQERLWNLIKGLATKSKMIAKLQELAAQGKVDRRGVAGAPLSAKQLVRNGLSRVSKQFQPLLDLSPGLWESLASTEAAELLIEIGACKEKLATLEEKLRPISEKAAEACSREAEEITEAVSDPVKENTEQTRETSGAIVRADSETQVPVVPVPPPEPPPILRPVFPGAQIRIVTSDDVLRELGEKRRQKALASGQAAEEARESGSVPKKNVQKAAEPEVFTPFTDADFPAHWPSELRK